MAINQISTANTFEQWLTTTSLLVAVANNLTDNTNGGFVANSAIYVQGANSSLNVRTLANINTLQANTANIANISLQSGSIVGNGTITMKDANIWSNIVSVNTTGNLWVGGDAFVYGNLTISGNVTLDQIGFDDLSVAGSASISDKLNVAGVTYITSIELTGNVVSKLELTSNLSVANQTILHNRVTAPNANIAQGVSGGYANIANIYFASGNITANGLLTTQHINVTSNIVSANITGNLFVANQTILYNRVTAPNANIAWENAGGYANIANIYFASGNITANGLLTTRSINVTQNIANVNVTGNLWVGGDTFIYGNLTITGNTTLDAIGFNDLNVAGSVNSTNLNTSTGNITLLVGGANTKIYSTITAAIDSAIAFSIALG